MGASRFFDADTEKIVVSDTAVLQDIFDGGGTVSSWTYLDTYIDVERIVSKVTTGQGWILYYRNANSSLSFFYYFSGNNYREDGTPTLSTGVWRYVTAVYDADSSANLVTFYVDGVAIASSTGTSPSGTRNSDVGVDLVIGNTQATNGAMRGNLSHVQAWDAALSVDQIVESMWKPGSVRTNLVGYWPCMGDATERDLSGNGNTGTVTGATVSVDGPPIRMF